MKFYSRQDKRHHQRKAKKQGLTFDDYVAKMDEAEQKAIDKKIELENRIANPTPLTSADKQKRAYFQSLLAVALINETKHLK